MSGRAFPAFLAGLLIAACGAPAPAADAPVTHVSQPAAGLEMRSSLDHSRLQGTILHLELALRNAGSIPVELQSAYCRYTPVTLIQDSQGTVVWSQPIPMIECANPPADMVQSIAPGEQRTGSHCWQLANGAGSCSPLNLPSGGYRVTGSFYSYPIPALDFQIVR